MVVKNETGAAVGAGTGDVVGPAGAVDENIAVFDGATGKLIKDGGAKIADLLGSAYNWDIIETAVDVDPAVKDTQYLVDAGAAKRSIVLPAVVADNYDAFKIFLSVDSHHVDISVNGGVQTIGGILIQGIRTCNSFITVKANGVDGYDLVEDTRVYDRILSVTADLDLSEGFESGALYEGNLGDGVDAVITILNWTTAHTGDFATFVKKSGANSSLRIVSEDATFNEVILENNTGFTLTNGSLNYGIKQDSRPSPSNVTINFFPTDDVSTIEPTYAGVVVTSNPAVGETVTAPAITSSDTGNPTFLGYFINDDKALVGSISSRAINGLAQIKLNASYNRTCRIKFKYHEYDYGTNTLNATELSETSYSSPIDNSAVFEQRFIAGTLPANTWADTSTEGKLIVMALYGVKSAAAGDNPQIDFQSGGTTPSVTSIDVPVSSVNHATLGGVVAAATGTPDGHVDNSKPLQFPQLTTVQRDAVVSPVEGMIITNTTNNQLEEYLGTRWLAVNPKTYIAVAETANEFTINQVDGHENFSGTITANATLKNFANPVVGTSGFFRLTTGGTGNYTLAVDTWFETPDDAGITLNPTVGGVTLIPYEVETTAKIRLDFVSYAS